MRIVIKPLTRETWRDLVELFGRPGASVARGCYCMCYRRSGKHEPAPGVTYSESNKRALKAGEMEIALREPVDDDQLPLAAHRRERRGQGAAGHRVAPGGAAIRTCRCVLAR